jgi:hypothetical protein
MTKIQIAHAFVQTDRVHLANSNEKAAAQALVAHKYAQCGYGEGHKLPAGCDTFVAFSKGQLAGTLSLAKDGPDGLPSDKIFRRELDQFRSSGAKLCELTRFVFDMASPSMTILTKLFAVIHDHGLRHYDCTDLVIAADPRHRTFYRRKWDFVCVGPPKMNTAFGVFSQLMRVPVAAIKPPRDSRKATRSLRPAPLILAQKAAGQGNWNPALR